MHASVSLWLILQRARPNQRKAAMTEWRNILGDEICKVVCPEMPENSRIVVSKKNMIWLKMKRK